MSENFNTRMTLIARLRNQHDAGAWQDFVFFYKEYIHAVVYNLGVNKSDVEDLTQNVLVVLWESLPKFDYQPDRCKFRTWMSTIIRNKVGRYFEKKQRYQRDNERAESIRSNKAEHHLPEVYEIAEHEWKLHVAELAWQTVEQEFSGKAMQCFELFMEGLSVSEISIKLDIKVNSAFVYRQRVQEKFYREIRRLDEELS